MKYSKMIGLCLTSSALAMAGCNFESGGNSNNGSSDLPEVEIDSTSGWTYFSFATEGEVDAADSWHLAFNTSGQRNDIRSNTALVELALAAPQDDFYNSSGQGIQDVFRSATAAEEEEHLLETYDDLSFSPDSIDATIGRDGSNFYSLVGSTYSAESDNWWLVQSAEGDSFAKLHFTDVSYDPGNHTLTIEAEMFVKEDGGTYGSAVTWTSVSNDPSSHCFDFDSAQTQSCNSATWDLQYTTVGRSSLFILTNGGFSGDESAGVYIADDGGTADDDSDDVYAMSKTDVDNLDTSSLSNDFSSDQEAETNMFSENSWYYYSGYWDGFQTHNILPNFRVYAVKDTATDEVTLFQVTSYYNEAAEGGHISLKYRTQD